MFNSRIKSAKVATILVLFSFLGLVFAGEVMSAAYQPCNIPPVVGSASRPNVFIVMDYSGSMQFPAYFDEAFDGYYGNDVADCHRDNIFKTYEPRYSYYGTFEPDKYYEYVPTPDSGTTQDFFKLVATQPVNEYAITNSADGGGGNKIIFTAAGHTFQVGDLVALYDLTSHLGLNYNAFPVTAVSGGTFTLQATTQNALKWNGKPDTAGKALKRVEGSLIPNASGSVPGVSGNVLNFAVTSRVDAALKALIGGRSICPTGDDYCYLRPQGSRRRVQDNTYLNADFYVRPATIESSTTYPDDYNTGSAYYHDDSDHLRDIFVTIKGRYSGQLSASHPVYYGKYFELWSFTLDKKTKIEMTLDGTWPGNDYLSIYTSPLINNGDNNGAQIKSSQANPASISTELDAGTYYVRATHSTQSLDPAYQVSYSLTSTVNLKPFIVGAFAHNGQVLTKIGALPWGRTRLRLEHDASGNKDSRNAVIQKSFPYVRFGFEYYNATSGKVGKIAVGCDNTDKSLLINAFEGTYRSDHPQGIDFRNIFPYNGTPTGEALQEARDYFAQSSGSSNADNSSFVGTGTPPTKGTARDPYYTSNAAGANVSVPCRKSFVILMSDGDWNGSVDPTDAAQPMHVNDLRSDVADSQTVDVFSIFAFSQSLRGQNSMKAIAMYGGFKHITGCGSSASYPYPESDLPSGSSLDFSWPRGACNPANSNCASACGGSCFCVKCCNEWNATWDRDKDGVDESKGIPDNFFQADDGKQLEDSLSKVMQAVTTGTAAASAVATVSQEMRSEDVIVRGVFEASDPDHPDDFLWKGHLEAYFPFTQDGTVYYDFELASFYTPSDPDLAGLCIGQPSGTRHCWDAGEILKAKIPVTPSARLIYTWLFDSTANKYVQKTFESGNLTISDLGVTTTAERDNIITWVRGDPITGYRDRSGWILGDIVYSTPVVIGPPRLGNVSKRDPNINTYQKYLDDQFKRSKVVYVGANDGMLHAFLMGTTTDGLTWAQKPADDSDIGRELWSYIPSNLLTELKALKALAYGTRTGSSPCTHRTMVDLAARHWEVYIKSDYCGSKADAQGRCWRSVIIGGERAGGDVYFAIDVTNPVPVASDPNSGPKVLWEYSVLKNRVVVESDVDTCLQACKDACTTTCTNNYNTCYNACRATGKSKTYCKNLCGPAQTTCQTTCESNCATTCASATYKAYVPFRSAYESIKTLPMSWSQPYMGRIHIPTSVKFYYGDPDATTKLPSNLLQFNSLNNNREVVFMGGGIHIYDKSFNSTPAIEDRFKLPLFWPNLLMIDIETGYNLFEYVWPIVLNYNSTTFPSQPVGGNMIPYAMSDVLALDVWDQTNHVIGDDGFIDRVYVGDMNGYFYGIKFNLAEHFPDDSTTNNSFGVEVNVWPTKPTSLTDQASNDYRSALQPITIAPAASLEALPARAASSASPALRIVFGTGKYDDVIYGDDDKTDTSKMALYNLRDPIINTISGVNYGLPIIDSSAREVFDASHLTNFKVKITPKCGLPSTVTGFLSEGDAAYPCDWGGSQKETDVNSPLIGLYRGDCCQSSCTSSPCYHCIYDFRNPCDSGSDGCVSPIDAKDGVALGKPGERVLGKPLIFAGMVFVTTFVPPFDACEFTGRGYLYVFDYMCQPFPKDYNPFPGDTDVMVIPSASGGTINPTAFQLNLGAGVPSRPVIDSRGERIIVQMSDGRLISTPVDPGTEKPVQFRGWRER
ncbi:MAG: hypothetical protein HY912_23905 [Desulfomonile tiedjei]|uniref:PilY1 beta-propeller domain-containing protein n=1 Tax=Desulfomonile tiedjei TaxID=2358 RepID=A0A9D6V9R8_9BACT|nr:hypothetical protein [Desulfomonile tiedjei]